MLGCLANKALITGMNPEVSAFSIALQPIKSVLRCFVGEFIRNITKNFANQEKNA